MPLKKIPVFLALFVLLLLQTGYGLAQVRVSGYFRKDGTYVAPHYRSSQDGNFYNNWTTSGNVNPYTGRYGTLTSPRPNYGKDVYVPSYQRSDGTAVKGHHRSAPDGNPYNNLKPPPNKVILSPSDSLRSSGPSIAMESARSFTTVPPVSVPKIAAPAVIPKTEPKPATDDDEMRRRQKSIELKSLGYDIPWDKYSYQTLDALAKYIRHGGGKVIYTETP